MTFFGLLRNYQKEVLQFTINKKAILNGMELGTGKTIVSLAYCEGIKHQNQNILVLCPSSIIYQWKEEIEKFTDSKATIIDGSKTKRQKQWQEESYYYITNYEKLRFDDEPFQKIWGVVILDECTKIKSPNAQLTHKAYQLRAIKKICLSGTPIHNTPNDLYSISHFLYPHLLGSWWQFANKYIEFEKRELIGGRVFNEMVGFKNLDELHERIKMFFIRKRKEEVLKELPPVIYETLTCKMNKNQQEVYDQIVEDIKLSNGENVLHLFTALKLLSNHPTLLSGTEGEKIKKFSPLVTNIESDKLKVLMEFLEDNRDKKIVIFSQYTKMLDIIFDKLTELKYMMVEFRGDYTKEENNENLHLFQNNHHIKILLSSDCGAYGVNLQCAEIIINYDLPYNPSIYQQRVGRLHRLGQYDSVICINLITLSSIEKRVLNLLSEKQNMIDKVIEGKIDETSFVNQILKKSDVN